jgi:hypothetical protein
MDDVKSQSVRKGGLISRRARKLAVAAAMLIGTSLIAAPPLAAAGNDGMRTSTTISISASVPAFHGRVRSGKKICKNHRRVQLLRKRAGKEPRRLGSDRTPGSGRWEVPIDTIKSGAYFAKVKPKRRRGCRGARSETAVID